VPIGKQHHGGVAVAIAVASGGFHQLVHFGIREVLARTGIGIWPPSGRSACLNCPNNGGRRDQRQA
jgi:hypothetical protein